MTSLEDQLLMQRQAARIHELELWLALLVIQYGHENGPGWRYAIEDHYVQQIRRLVGGPSLGVSITLDLDTLIYVIDVI